VFGWARELLGVTGALLAGLLILRLAWRPLAEWGRAAALSVRAHRAFWRGRPARLRALAGAGALLLLLLLCPRWITVTGGFTAAPSRSLPLIAPDSGIVKQVLAHEGTRIPAGAPVIRIQDLALEQARAARLRARDSLAAEEIRARAHGEGADAERLGAERAVLAARLGELDARLAALVLRARAGGDVLTPRPEQLMGRRVESGDTLVILGDADSLEVRVALDGAGATLVRPGQTVSLLSYAAVARPILGVVHSVSPAAGLGPHRPGVEVRARVPAGGSWRVGVTGEASVRLRRSNLLGALWWGARQRIRSDLLL
jgi:multidrug efflux pump subunit AcrA (membrane-fusion protein)